MMHAVNNANSMKSKFQPFLLGLSALVMLQLSPTTVFAFEGRIQATLTRGDDTQNFYYTVGTNQLRIERAETNWPHAKNIVARDTGAITLMFPHNRSFVRLKNVAAGGPRGPLAGEGGSLPPGPALGLAPGVDNRAAVSPGIVPSSTAGKMPTATATVGPTNLPGVPARPQMPQMPQLPAGVGPQAAAGLGTMPAMPAMPMMPMMPMEKAELKATGEKTNLLGYTCARYELKQRGEVMEIWATDKLLPFQAWLPNQPSRFGPRLIEEQWSEMLRTKKLFPLRAVLKFENGPERLRFEVTAVTPEKIKDEDGKLFQPPPDYHELEPLPF
mgnify:CR=1 FL=1